jgi:predicted RNase H-like HicB family nuclease
MSMHHDQLHYSMTIEWEPQGQVFVVTVPELRGCMTHGATYEEAVAQGRDAIESWLDAREARGASIPSARYYHLGEAEAPEPVGASAT